MSFLKKVLAGMPKVSGELGYFRLGDWWFSTFTEEERKYIERVYKPMSIGRDNKKPLTEGEILHTNETAANLLSALAGWFKKSPRDLSIARRILEKAAKLTSDPIELHYVYQATIQVNYPHRDSDPNALDQAIKACQNQIHIAPQAAKAFKKIFSVEEAERTFGARLPAHVGYTQFVIILEKEKRYTEAIQLVKQAKAQEWNGDWDKRLDRLQKKVQK